jgi:hypothetical protein
MRWGLIPSSWKKSAREVPSTFNARAETVAQKPMFRAAFKRGRCVVPSLGLLRVEADAEWQAALQRLDARRLGALGRRPVGRVERRGDGRGGEVVHDHRHRGERPHAAERRGGNGAAQAGA